MHIIRGSTFRDTLRWATSEVAFRAITGVSTTAPCQLIVPGHGLIDGWRAAFSNVKGTTELNAKNDPPKPADYVRVRAIDENTIEVPRLDASGFKAYKGGGTLRYHVPVDLAGYAARMQIKDKVGGTVLLELTTENDGIVLDNVTKTITRHIDAAATAALAWKKGVYDLELVQGADVVKLMRQQVVTVEGEVTT